MIAVIDVDNTVVDSGYHWYQWLELMTKAGYKYEDVCAHHNFTSVYKSIWNEKELSGEPLDYWRASNIYGDMVPYEHCIDTLKLLKNKGYKIVFVSALKGNHHKGKYEWCEKWFPFMDAFVGTKEKWTVGCDLIIDDRNENLNMFPNDSVVKIRKNTPYSQSTELTVNLDGCMDSWLEIKEWVETWL